ncbi:acyltransferase family protein [Companilactobacillus mishanensis]|uniref:acyltransferase family protein n=1 Tax=Companilactobacillus mishanensis TaxID=2486008 RepID=UPI001296F64D|nr:acyltransferase [Companilactobacillus mishanensis]MQS88960.1 acyltransferase [Companilactobacillus mishanensis]
MKVFACTAVMLQSVLGFVVGTEPSNDIQIVISFLYNLVKFTAPAFIFGILYSTMRTNMNSDLKNYPHYLKKQWSALFIPTIWWTLAYLLIFPTVQQINHYNNLSSFLWQFINGNAAPHLWYNTMMLQFIILMPLFWMLGRWANNSDSRALWIIIITIVGYFAWIYFYDLKVFHGLESTNWYLLDRLFISFIIYGIFGVIAWIYREQFENLIKKSWIFILVALIATFIWTNKELLSFGFPLKLANAPYYKPSMTLYSLLVIGSVATLAINHLRKNSKVLPVFHFLAVYAYRAYLSNVFWLEIIWLIFGKTLAQSHPIWSIFICYFLTWILSFCSAYLLHIIWSKMKSGAKQITA